MKKISILILSAIVLFVFSNTSSAVILDGYTHTNDYYSVSYDAEGDAVVRAKIIISNDGNFDISDLSLEFPGRDIVFYGVFSENPYFSRITDLSEVITSESTVLKIKLKEKIPKGSKSSFIIIYKISNSAEKTFGVYNFEFRTIIDSKAKIVENVRVAVNVDSNLFLKGTDSEVDYRADFFSLANAEKLASMSSADVHYQDSFSNIMQSSGIVKAASNLDPWESFVVKGEYSRNYFLVHKGLVSFFILIALAIITAAVFGIKRIKISSFALFSRKITSNTLPIYLISALQSFGLLFLWFAGWLLLKNLHSLVGYRYDDIFAVGIIMTLAVLMIAVLLMPPALVAKREGNFRGILTFVLVMGWLFLIIAVLIFIFSAISPQQVIYKG